MRCIRHQTVGRIANPSHFVPALLGALLLAAPAAAQQPQLGSALPKPRLFTVVPAGGKAGTSVEVTFTGTELDEPEGLLFSHGGIKAEPIMPAEPAPPDPKKPAPKPNPKQPNRPAPVVTKFKVTIPADTPPGIHDVRLVNKWGVSNPRAFVIGDLAEVLEKEPNNDVPEAQRVELNTTVTGAVSAPTDVDYYVFAGKKGQRVVVSCLASSIDSRLLPEVELHDKNGRLLGYSRNYHGTDALLDATLPQDGDYYVRLYEFAHTLGSAEHFYRLSITTGPWIDAVFPAVVEPGKPAKLTVYGRNLPDGKPDPSAVVDGKVLEKITVTVNVPADPMTLQRLAYTGHVEPPGAVLSGFEYRVRTAVGVSNPFLLTYAKAPLVIDNGANDTPETAQEISLPCEIAGWVEKKHDRDWYSFTAKKGEVYHIEVLSERLGSPTSMVFVLHNPATMQVLFESPDNPDILSPKFFSRTDDPAVYKFTVPADGKYQLLVQSQNGDTQASPRHLYQVRITPEQPGFHLVVMGADDARPDSCQLDQGGNQSYTVFALRQDGWNGDINLSAEGLPKGVTCVPQAIGAGLRHASLVVTAAADAAAWTGAIKIKGTATIKGQAIVREARGGSITWPSQQPQQPNLPVISRVDQSIVLAVRGKAPYSLNATIDKNMLLAGEKATLTVKLNRLWPDFKTPLTVQAQVIDLPPNNVITINSNQPLNMAPGKDDGTLAVDVKANAPPGTYTIVLRSQAQIPYQKDPKGPKANLNVVQPSSPVTITVLPKTVATVALLTPNPTVKVGMQTEVGVKVNRLYDYAGEFKVQIVLPPNAKGVSATDVTIPAGQDEAKFVLKADANAAPGGRADLIVRATAMVGGGKVTTTQEVKFSVNVVK